MRLGWTAEQCLAATPEEIAIQVWADRTRRNRHLAERAWEIAWLISPHVKESVPMDRILNSAPGYEPDAKDLRHG